MTEEQFEALLQVLTLIHEDIHGLAVHMGVDLAPLEASEPSPEEVSRDGSG